MNIAFNNIKRKSIKHVLVFFLFQETSQDSLYPETLHVLLRITRNLILENRQILL